MSLCLHWENARNKLLKGPDLSSSNVIWWWFDDYPLALGTSYKKCLKMAMAPAEKSADTGTVNSHAIDISPNSFQLTPFVPLTCPTITTEPTLQWVVLTGMPTLEAIKTVVAEPISIVNPVDGVILERSLPIVWMTRLPQTQRPMLIQIPPYKRMYQGVGPSWLPCSKSNMMATSGPMALLFN